MGLVELVIRLHKALHQPDQIPENLHAANAVEILGRGVPVIQRVALAFCKIIDGGIGICFIGGDAGQEITAHLSPGFHNGLQVCFCRQIAAD